MEASIDEVLQKVQEGGDVFDTLWDKVYHSDDIDANQKEKCEAELKKEIKKLQRYRHQILTWIQSSEIKDNKALMEARKQVVREMERFKICEEETKMKALPNEDLKRSNSIPIGASRNLQVEIDRVLEKVQQDDVFDRLWNKVCNSDNANQKEKCEAELKKEIKKLQRYRHQIMSHIQPSEIKDKVLMDARKLVIHERERFKILEEEIKTKSFS